MPDKIIHLNEALAKRPIRISREKHCGRNRYQRCVVHFYRNVLSATPPGKMKEVAAMLKAIHAQEDVESTRKKALAVAQKLKTMKQSEAARKIETGIEKTLT